MFSNRIGENMTPPATTPCVVCKEPTKEAGEIDRGQGWQRVAICSVDCLNTLTGTPGAGHTVRSRFPA